MGLALAGPDRVFGPFRPAPQPGTQARRWWFPTVGLYVVFYLALVFLIDLPLAYYLGFVRQHAYGLSNQTLAGWWTDALMRRAV